MTERWGFFTLGVLVGALLFGLLLTWLHDRYHAKP